MITWLEFEKQTDPLHQEDLTAMWYCMMQIKSQQTIAFYNCGELSGARYCYIGMKTSDAKCNFLLVHLTFSDFC